LKSVYVETRIRTPLETLWKHTQDPSLHERWDLRFSEIQYLPRLDLADPQRFLYATRIGFGREIRGEGESVGTRDGPEGERTSALRFWSEDPASLIREGSGYWKYVPTADGIRFLTDYNYRTRFGAPGRVFDSLIFRPLIGWATAWSFDRLRLWLEKGVDPSTSRQLGVLYSIARISLAFVWIYHGLVPKILFQDADEVRMLARSGVPPGSVTTALFLIGVGEALLGLAFLFPRSGRMPFLVSLAFLAVATLLSITVFSEYLTGAFNPITLNVLGISLSIVGLIAGRHAPSARRCVRKPGHGART
jgi:uncharacterized membrane protein YphA (DoxX/SURF4 family)